MPRLVGTRQVWQFLLYVISAAVALLVAPRLADVLISGDAPALSNRVAAVLIGTISVLPLIGCMAWLYQRSDEFERQRMLLQWSGALAGDLVLVTLQERLVLTGFLVWERALPHFALMIIAWGISVFLVAQRDRVVG